MANWEYKVISSGKGGFASPALMEKFINDLGQEQWEIINFHSLPDNALAFTGLARRPTQRDWTLEDAAAAAARAETDKLRVEFEAKFKAGVSGEGRTAAEEKAESFAEEKASADDGFRRPVDTSRDGDPDAPEGEDEWQKLSEEDELPTFFDALKPHMRRNQRGPGMSVGIDFLAKKWKLEEADIKTALVECGLQIPADENAKPVYVEYDGDLFWVNINRRGEVWLNTREKPEPVFRIVPAKQLTEEETAAVEAAIGAPQPQPQAQPAREPRQPQEPREPRDSRDARDSRDQAQRQPQSAAPREPKENRDTREPREAKEPREPREQREPRESRPEQAPQGEKPFLAKVRSMMRRNRRGRGGSGSFQFLTKALKLDEAGLLAKLAEFGLRLDESGKHVIASEGGFDYWLNKNQRGEIWINAEESRGGKPAAATSASAVAPTNNEPADKSGYIAMDGPADTPPDYGPMGNVFAPKADAHAPAPEEKAAPVSIPAEAEASTPVPTSAKKEVSAPVVERDIAGGNTLAAIRLLMEPKKRGEGVTALVAAVAEKLEKSDEHVLEALAAAGLQLPDSPKAKPTFAEQGGEIFWLNVNAKGQVWVNAKSAKKTRSKKSSE